MNAQEFGIWRGPLLKTLAKDTESMSAAAFKRKYGIDVRECRAKLKRLRELAALGHGADEEELRELVGLFTAICLRQEG